MSSIDKLGIRGIRSFGPDTEEVIQFYKPLTVIVGPNGCGKTTIIECLKYVTTGLLPPSAKNGQNFVHDPKLAGTTKVSAQIKLTLRTNARERMYLGRSMELHQKRTKMEFKATDGVVKIRKADGTESTQTHRCSDLDRSVPEFMGVSRPILESVIFCHQEDSNWPLQEAAVLKKKFDDIFESTRYTKALDVIRKQRKSLVDAYKDAQRDLDVLQHTLGIAQGKRDEMERLEGERERLVDAQREAEERREEVQNQLREYDAVMNDLLDLERDIEQAELLFREREAVFRRSTAELDGYDTAGDKAALQEAVFKVDGQMAEKRARRIQVSEQEASAQRKVDKLIAEAQGVAVSQATLQEKHRVHDSAKRRMQRTARELQKRYALPQSAVQCQTTHEAMGILRRIKQAREEAEATLDQHERGTRERSDKLSDAVNAARAAESDLDIRMAHVEQQRQECASRVAEIKREMQSAGRGGSNAQQFADRVKNEIKRLSEQEQDAPRRELAELQRQEGERQKRVEELSAELMTAEPLLHSLEANQEEIARVSARRMDIQARRERLLGDVQSRAHKVTEAFDAVNALGDGAGETVALSPQVQDLIEGSTDVDVVGLAPGLLGSLQDGERKLKAHSHDLESQLKRKDQELFLLSTKVREAKQKMEFLMKEVETCDSKLPKAIRDKVNELSEAAEEAGAGGEHESEGERLERVVVAPLRKRVADKEDRFKLIANKKTLARVNMKRVKKTGKCPTCDQSVEPCEFVLDSNITWFGDVLEASVYTGVDALVVKLAESVSGDKYVEEVTRREEELRSDQRQLEQMMPYIPVLVRLNELEKQQTQTMDLWQVGDCFFVLCYVVHCMYVCIFVCMYVCNVCMHVCMYVCMYALYALCATYVCMYVCAQNRVWLFV
jgi:DNA repair exonuclease SbcCD ATPase subunit